MFWNKENEWVTHLIINTQQVYEIHSIKTFFVQRTYYRMSCKFSGNRSIKIVNYLRLSSLCMFVCGIIFLVSKLLLLLRHIGCHWEQINGDQGAAQIKRFEKCESLVCILTGFSDIWLMQLKWSNFHWIKKSIYLFYPTNMSY